MRIPLNNFKRQWSEIGDDALDAMRRVGESGWYVLGDEVAEFERALAESWPASFAVGTGNGLDSLEIALRCAGIKPEDKVITTPLSAFASTLAILRAGATPVFVDVDENGLLDLDLVAAYLATDREIRCILPVHLFGIPLDLEHLSELNARYDVAVIEDCAQAIHAKYNGQSVGSVSVISATSFYPTKNLGAVGDAGAVVCHDGDMADQARCLRNYGQTSHYVHDFVGLNSRLDELHAAVMRQAILPRLPTWETRRQEIADSYFAGIENPLVKMLEVPESATPVWHLFPVLLPDGHRDGFRTHLAARGIGSGLHYPFVIPDQAALEYPNSLSLAGPIPNARHFANCEVSLPIHPHLTNEEVTQVITACNSWLLR